MALSKEDNPEKASPKKSKAVPDTPSAQALAEVGPPPEGASDVELTEHAAKYAEAKSKARWG